MLRQFAAIIFIILIIAFNLIFEFPKLNTLLNKLLVLLNDLLVFLLFPILILLLLATISFVLSKMFTYLNVDDSTDEDHSSLKNEIMGKLENEIMGKLGLAKRQKLDDSVYCRDISRENIDKLKKDQLLDKLNDELRKREQMSKITFDVISESVAYISSGKILQRIYTAIKQQERKANLNLVLGVVIAIVGIGVLIFFVPVNFSLIKNNTNEVDLYLFLIHFFPKLSIVLLIETFAYFFLRLYRVNLDEIKYLHNEATSIEHRLYALEIALKQDDKEIIKEILLFFAKFDKNINESPSIQENTPVSLEYLVKLTEVLNKK